MRHCVSGAREAAAGEDEAGRAQRRPLACAMDGAREVIGRKGRGAALAAACVLLVFPAAAGSPQLCFSGQVAPQRRLPAGSAWMPRTTCGGGRLLLGASMMAEGGEEEAKLLNSRRLARWADGLAEDDARVLGSRRVARGISSMVSRSPSRSPSSSFSSTSSAGSDGDSEEAGAEIEQLSVSPEIAGRAAKEAEKLRTINVAKAEDPLTASSASATSMSAASGSASAPALRVASEARGASEEENDEEWGGIFAAGTPPARPDNIPSLTLEDEGQLLAGERVQKQTRDGRVGQGMVVVDVRADISTVFAVLTDLERYTERISTVRRCRIYERGTKIAKAQFALSRFMLEVNTVLRCERDANTLRFELDKEKPSLIMEEAKGQWFLEAAPGRGGEWTRVWLTSEIRCSPLLPTFLVDYAASRALPRATRWLKPTIELIAEQLPDGAGSVRDARVPTPEEAAL